MEFKKFILWSSDEDKILKDNYLNNVGIKHFNHFKYLKELLYKNGYNRSLSAVARRFHRLGLKYYSTKQTEIKGVCSDCGIEIIIYKRYANRKNKMQRCFKCQDYKNREYDRINKDRFKKYHADYMKKWIQKNKELSKT